jgi:zinc protease
MRHDVRLRTWASLAAAVALAAGTPASLRAQAPAAAPAQTVAPQQPSGTLPFDPAVTTGSLPNGLRYYIRHNERPDDRVSMQLAVKAGSVDETDAQQGLAHFLEHMAFNGTTHFKAGELIATLESSGARMGPHVNAYTAFDETVYMFELPTTREGLVEKGLQALGDFAGGMTLDPAEIDKERGVVLEEWRGGLGAAARIRDQQLPVLYQGSKYAERLPIGKPEILKSFPASELRAFYEKWYRPDRMAVVVVGDVDVPRVERLIRDTFGPLAKPASAPPSRTYPLPLPSEVEYKVATDPEVTQSSVSIVRKRRSESRDTVADYRRSLVRRLIFQMLNDRFDEMTRKVDAPFLSAGAYGGALTPEVSSVNLGAGVQEGRIEQGLAALAIEARRVVAHGFGPGEIDRAKKWTLAGYDRAYTERDKTESGSYVQEYVSHFLEGEPSPGIAYEYDLAKQMVPSIAAAEIDAAGRDLFGTVTRTVLAVAPQKPDLPVPTETQLAAALAATTSVAVTAYVDTAAASALMETLPSPAAVTARRELPDLGVTVVTFANGVEAWLKPTDFKNDQVLFSLSAVGGTSLAPPDTYREAQLASSLVGLSGVGGHKAVDLQKITAGKIAGASPYMSLSTHGISGSSTPANLETALQLLYLDFTAPGDDPEAFAVIKRQLQNAYANRDRDPNAAFSEKFAEVNTMGHYTSAPLTLDRIAALDRSAMASFYRERFANAADFAFFIVGAFSVDDAVPLLARYVGSLPSTGEPTSTFRDVGLTFPTEVVRATVEKGREPKATTVISFFADPPLEENEQGRVDAADEVLEIALRDILREELGETYSVSVGLSQSLPQRGTGRISISFGSAPDNVDRMVTRILQEVQRLQKEGPSDDLTGRAKESARRSYETSMKQNQYWLARLQSAKLLGRDPALMLHRLERIDAVTPDLLQQTFRKYFPMDRYTVVSLLPAKSAQ